ncbi:NAD(P)/FAD-dependent oxidoreductase [Amycolatopsis taiwanensis]|uniref:Thioredoxin reductase n=1 Tax=Amycolatopsis taiwanensis TaxID=342230 RepID=A0A9W6VEE9_9PSEU|nr:NAD(P)/FAD-dependent oxidoreductase [Amycolatopsis taiwanensis]GLY63426.1 thioredoxin reductase [Amycolatopsis taiwanensis]
MTEEFVPGHDGRYDVVIVGGGPAGLSGALMLGRARRSVLVIDSGQPRNAPAAHMHGFLSRDGVPPGELLEAGRQEAAGYGAQFSTGCARSATRDDRHPGGGFAVELDTGRTVRARRLLVTTGITDELPDIPGLAPRWGRDVLHCPYCHGWEVRDQPVGVLATGPMSVHQALLFRQWTDRLTLLLHTGPGPSSEEAEQLAARDIAVVAGEVSQLEIADDHLTGVRLRSGELIPLRALAVAPRAVPHSEVLAALGLEPAPHPRGLGEHIVADSTGLTAVPGVWVAGNLADPAANVLLAAASGATAAGAINADLVAEDTRRAVAARKDPFAAESEARLCEHVMGDRRHGL